MRHKVSHQQKITEGPSSKTVGSSVVDVTVCPKAGCDVGCFPLCVLRSLVGRRQLCLAVWIGTGSRQWMQGCNQDGALVGFGSDDSTPRV